MMDEEDMSDIDYHLEWRKVQARSYLVPPVKAYSASVAVDRDVYLFGGQGAGQFSEVWKFSYERAVWTEVACTAAHMGDIPTARDGHTLVKVSDTKLIVYAGQGGLFDTGKCERATEHGKVKYLSMRKLFDDMFELDISTMTWIAKPRRKIRPLGRRGHTMTYLKPTTAPVSSVEDRGHSKGLGKLLLFGGSCLDTSTGFEKVSNDVWLYSLNDEQWTEVQCGGVRPRAVYGHSAVLMDESYIIVGGCYAPPKKKGFLSKAKAMAPKKKVVNNFSSALSDCADTSNTISVLNVTTFQWSILCIDAISPDLDSAPPELHLTGHSAMESPLNAKEILIFGGRSVEDVYTGSDLLGAEESSFDRANLFALNIEDCTLKHIAVKNDGEDDANVPAARLNHICQRHIDGHIVLNYNREEAKSKKSKNGRRIFDITAKKKQILGQAVTLVYGGLKTNSPGFCDSSVYELFFVPTPNRKEKDDSEIKFISPEDNAASAGVKDEMSHVSKLSIESFDFDDRLSSMDRSSNRSMHDSEASCTMRALKLKGDCSTQLLSPKRGVDGHYFDLKSSLSYSKSKFVPSSSKYKSSESEPPAPSLEPLSHNGNPNGDDDDSSLSSTSVLTAERMHFMSSKEIMRARMHEVAPKTKGMTVHGARFVYNKMYPLPGTSRVRTRGKTKKLL